MEKAKEALKEGTSLSRRRIKLIRIADKSEFSWETVNHYEADELASNSEDDKRVYRSERRAQKKHKEKKKKKSPPVRYSFLPPVHFQLLTLFLQSSRIEVCCDHPWVLALLAGNLVIFKPSAPKGQFFSQQALTLRSPGLRDGLRHACEFR